MTTIEWISIIFQFIVLLASFYFMLVAWQTSVRVDKLYEKYKK